MAAPSPISPEEQRALDEVRDRLAAMFPGSDVAAIVAESHRRFDGGKIRDFVPLFVERDARTRLAGAQG
ncbi:three-helix bundle dimerization domain-containing protein [Rhodococcus sp. P1Y]|uniref:three-helix bundle dimerization domain-containing protein n=1 Tax=Rhodococcus sp. P1Y TaxID=1302308 RepID=UPI000EADCCDF|nr:hypothetical protein [Rhodococcus sp. P1Y]AYJ48063.1 hypothetical protein D8W71_06645 [Rhodococcus sp. P1Y]